MGVHMCGWEHGFIEDLGWLGTDLVSHRTGDVGEDCQELCLPEAQWVYFWAGLGRPEGFLGNEEFFWGR